MTAVQHCRYYVNDPREGRRLKRCNRAALAIWDSIPICFTHQDALVAFFASPRVRS